MTSSRDDLVALLHDFGDVDPPRPAAVHEGVARRIQRHKRRRLSYAAACMLVVIVATVGLVHVAAGPRPVNPSSPAVPAPLFTSNGVTYHRVALVYLDTRRQTSVAVTIPAGTTPVAVFASCRLASVKGNGVSAVTLSTTPSYQTLGSEYGCANANNANTHVEQLDRSALPGNGTELTFLLLDTYADGPADAPALWAFAIYTVTVPAPPPTPISPPPSIMWKGSTQPAALKYSLVHTYSGFWPAQRTVRVTIPAGAPSVMAFLCPDPLAGHEISLSGNEDVGYLTDVADRIICGDPTYTTATAIAQLGSESPPPPIRATAVTFTLAFDPADQTFPGQWVIAVYQR